ncbi:MAG: acyl-CoA dehydrogenase family protein [Dehalococcoidales bacterium]|nr:acyl-CoA dehydrogenase family protein [Dehalococcoidales bacterium]
MDFEYHFSEELEAFRSEVRAFIEEHAYKEPIVPPDPVQLSPEMFVRGKELSRKMGERGWYAPAYPGEYGGGGLDLGHCVVLAQEFGRIKREHRWPGSTEVSAIHTGGIMAHGTEEQKRRFLPKLLRGDWHGAQCFTEPEAGSDEAAMKSTAVRDGDVYIINGEKVFVGGEPVGGPRPDYLYWAAVTDSQAPRHENISAFFIPADLPGITYIPLNLVGGGGGQRWHMICEDVRCPADCMIGEENKGWLVTQATLHLEHGGGGHLTTGEHLERRLIDYCKKTLRNGKPISSDPIIRDILIQLYTEAEVARLWGVRNFAMAQGQIPRVRYTGTQTSLHRKRSSPVRGKVLLDILGPASLISDPELQILLGEVELEVRLAEVTHVGGTPEVMQIMMSRALGLGRSAVRAAPR